MSNVAISALPAASSVPDTDLFAVVEIGTPNVTRQATAAQVRAPLLPLAGGTMTGPLVIEDDLRAQDSTNTNYFDVSTVQPTDTVSGNAAMTVSNLSMTSNAGSGTLSDVAFVMTQAGDPGYNGYTTQMLYGYQGTVGTHAITGQAALIQSARAALAAGTNPVIYGAWVHYVDQTAQVSSKTNSSWALQLTFEANGADDATNRRLVNLHLNRPGLSGTDVGADAAIYISGEASHHTFNNGITFAGSAAVAGMNTTLATEATNANMLWVAQGQHIGFDQAGGSGHALSRMSGDGLTLNVTTPIKPGVYTVATLPSVTGSNTGAVAFASNARNTGEGAGVGTGCLVTVNNAGTWISVWSGVAPTT